VGRERLKLIISDVLGHVQCGGGVVFLFNYFLCCFSPVVFLVTVYFGSLLKLYHSNSTIFNENVLWTSRKEAQASDGENSG
jgi:hypothetical protein